MPPRAWRTYGWVRVPSAPCDADERADVGLFRTTAFGRGYTDMMLCFALFCLASWIALWVDRSDRPQRSVVELVSVTGAVLAAGATLALPGISGHAAQTSPRGISASSVNGAGDRSLPDIVPERLAQQGGPVAAVPRVRS